jgi:hypothetical protein
MKGKVITGHPPYSNFTRGRKIIGSLQGKFVPNTWNNNCNQKLDLKMAHTYGNMSWTAISTCWKQCCVDRNVINVTYNAIMKFK